MIIEKKTSNLERAKKARKMSEYGRQLFEKQKVRQMYGMREQQFRRFFKMATRSKEATGAMLLSLLERRLDNVVYRSKFSISRMQARQIIVHGHVLVNGRKVYSPSYLINVNDEITFAPNIVNKTTFLDQVVDKRLKTSVKVPEWIELDKQNRKSKILRLPVQSDIATPIDEHLIVEFYSK